MDILFEIVSRQKHSITSPTSHVFGEAGGYIGRGEECEWVLPDRSKRISRQHALITYEDGAFFLEDISSNGTFFSLAHEPVGKNRRHKIEHGEGFVIGEYTIMARLMQNPASYAPSASVADDDLLSFSRSLSLNPLTAMDQEEERVTRNRMGEFDDIFGKRASPVMRAADHSDPCTTFIPPIAAIPEYQEIIPDDWDTEPDMALHTPPLHPEASTLSDYKAAHPVPPRVTAGLTLEEPPVLPARVEPPPRPVPVSMPETDAFFHAVGFAEPPSSPEERERILRIAGELLVAMTDGMTRALQNRAECKNDLRLPVTTTGIAVSNNPFKFSPTPEAALATLLGAHQKGVQPPVEALTEGFNDLHSHHMGLLAGARAAVRALLDKISPEAVETRLDLNGAVHLGRTKRLWHTFIRMHHALRDDHEGFAGLFLQDFARAYEVQGRTLNPPSPRSFSGEKL